MDNNENKESLKENEFIGTEQLTEIYKIISEKAIESLKNESVLSNDTYKMITMAQDLYNQMNAQYGNYVRFPYWGTGFGNNCV